MILKKLAFIIFLLAFSFISTFAQIIGSVVDSKTHEPLSYIAVFYKGKGVGAITNAKGQFKVKVYAGWSILSFSAVGYVPKDIKIIPGKTKNVSVQLDPTDVQLDEVVVKPKKEKYRRKNNPAVILMRKVIANKKKFKLEENDFYRYDKYQKLTLSLNNITPEKLNQGIFKKMKFLKDQVEVCEETKKLILPISIQETVSDHYYRRKPKDKKVIIKGLNTEGVSELFSTGDVMTTVLKDIFADINIYDNNIRLLQQRFVSPISSSSAISFYKYYIMDTLQVKGRECIHLSFVPQNSQDFGFTGHLYVLNDSTHAVTRCTMKLPKKTGVNFVDNMDVSQEFEQMPNGEWVLSADDMLVELRLVKALQGFQVRRLTRYSDYAFEALPKQLFKGKKEVKEPQAMMKSDDFWNSKRIVPLTKTESSLNLFVRRLEEMPNFKYIIFVFRALIENFVETAPRGKPNKVDIGPVNTIITSNSVEGLRLRGSALTTAKLNPHWFLSGYAAYGFKDHKWKGKTQIEYSIEKKEYLAREFPKHAITATAVYDVFSPSDKFLKTDKDNMFVSFKATKVDQMSYMRNFELKYERETQSGFSTTLRFRNSNDEPTGTLVYAQNTPMANVLHDITTTDVMFKLRYAPGETFINTKQRRTPVTFDAPIFILSHTLGVKALGGQYKYNMTELSIRKRFWLSSWGSVDTKIKGGVQWNKVPFPMLFIPAANLSYISQRETFSLMNNMEFFNDRYASLHIGWNMNGKIFNRIPLLKKLKLREFIGFKMLYGELSDKNNPFINANDNRLFRFPTRNGKKASFVMDKDEPYMEVSFGIHNIFKLLHVDYVRRLSYLDHPNINKWGIRFKILMEF